jgi:isopenicillin-N N-acyltransferase-like protein
MTVNEPIQILNLEASTPREIGRIHGESLRKAIKEIFELRLERMLEETEFKTREDVASLAKLHLPVLQTFDQPLYEELIGIAEGSGCSPEDIVTLNHYTDMRDLKPTALTPGQEIFDEGGCSLLYSPSSAGPLFGQTWDIHGSATKYVVMLRIKEGAYAPDEAANNEILAFSIAGCLGMCGMSNQGVGVLINNLSSRDAHIGVVWPAVVRKALRQTNAKSAAETILSAPLGSGHNYAVADEHDFLDIETSGTKKKVVHESSAAPYHHTNHCLDPEMAGTHWIRPGSTTFVRYAILERLLQKGMLKNGPALYEALGQVSQPMNEQFPHRIATCGAIAMELKNKRAFICKGPPSEQLFNNPATVVQL